MKWAWRIGRIAGIDIRIHATFLILLAWVAVTNWLVQRDVRMMAGGVAFVLAIFLCVVLHELGHALAARSFGISTRDITLLPIGGVARLERMPDDPKQEIWVALAGPAVNVVIALGLWIGLKSTSNWQPLGQFDFVHGSIQQRLFIVNVFLVAFNLLPAFPMDGGRVLRGILAIRLPYAKATRIAATLGQFMAFAFAIFGVFSNPFLIFIALFVWIGAAREAEVAEMKSALSGVTVDRAMLTDFRTLEPAMPLSRVIELILAGSQEDFPVLEERRLVGVLTRRDLLLGLSKAGQSGTVGEFMRRDFKLMDAGEMLDVAVLQLQTDECKTVPVVRSGELVGLLTLENVGEFLMINSALENTTRT